MIFSIRVQNRKYEVTLMVMIQATSVLTSRFKVEPIMQLLNIFSKERMDEFNEIGS